MPWKAYVVKGILIVEFLKFRGHHTYLSGVLDDVLAPSVRRPIGYNNNRRLPSPNKLSVVSPEMYINQGQVRQDCGIIAVEMKRKLPQEGQGLMDDVESTLRAVEQARRRKRELKTLLGVLYEEYKLVKAEIKLHEARLEKWMSEKEYAAFLDTIKMDDSLEFDAFSDQKPTNKK